MLLAACAPLSCRKPPCLLEGVLFLATWSVGLKSKSLWASSRERLPTRSLLSHLTRTSPVVDKSAVQLIGAGLANLLYCFKRAFIAGPLFLWCQVDTLSGVTTFLICSAVLPRRVCCSWLSAMPVQHARVSEQAQESISPRKN